MLKLFYSFVLSVLFLVICSNNGFSQKEALKGEIKKLIKYDTEIDFEETPGFIIGVIDQDSSFIIDFGHTDKNELRKLNKNSIFELGSLTKVFTASLISVLVDKSLLSYSDKVNDLLPVQYRNENLKELCIENLLNHTSGFPNLPASFGVKQEDAQNPYAHYSKADLLAYYQSFKPVKRKKENIGNCLYSHVNYALLEIIIETQMSNKLDSVMQQYLLEPLGLEDTYFINSKKETTPGFDRTLRQVEVWDFSSFAGSEGIKSSMNDLLMFLRSQLDTKNSGNFDFSSLHTMDVPTSYNKRLFVGKAWHIVKQKPHSNIVSHTGKTTGHQAFMAFVKKTRTGVVVLSNSAHGVEDLGFLILRMINRNWKRKS